MAQKSLAANPGNMPPRETRFLKTSVVDRGLNLHRSKPVLRTDSAWCPLPWQIVVSVRTTTTLSGFSLRKKSIEFCAKAVVVSPPYYREPRWSTIDPPEVREFRSKPMMREVERVCGECGIELLQVEYTQMADVALLEGRLKTGRRIKSCPTSASWNRSSN